MLAFRFSTREGWLSGEESFEVECWVLVDVSGDELRLWELVVVEEPEFERPLIVRYE